MRRTRIALLLVLTACTFIARRNITKPDLADFHVYATAAELLHEKQRHFIYDGADTGEDPQLRLANPGSIFEQTARHLGYSNVRLYVYPPLLADLIVPLTFLSPHVADTTWIIINCLALGATAWLLIQLMHLDVWSLGAGALVWGLLVFSPTESALIWGQITVILLLLWVSGIYFYQRGRYSASAICFAIAAVIKLTPLIVVLPFLLWREWRWLRVFAASLLVCLALMCIINSPACVNNYVRHVMPSMSQGIASFDNKSLSSSIQVVYVTLISDHHVTINGLSQAIRATPRPRSLGMLARICSIVLILLVAIPVLRAGPWITRRSPVPRQQSPTQGPLVLSGVPAPRAMILALFAIISVVAAPVSWTVSYIVCFVALAMLWDEALRARLSMIYLGVLTTCSLQLSCSFFSYAALKHVHGGQLGAVAALTPLAACLLVLYRFYLPVFQS